LPLHCDEFLFLFALLIIIEKCDCKYSRNTVMKCQKLLTCDHKCNYRWLFKIKLLEGKLYLNSN